MIRKPYFSLFLLCLPLFSLCSSGNDDPAPAPAPGKEWLDPIRVATYNIQYDNRNEEAGRWENRKEIVCRLLEAEDFDIFGAQEPYKFQIEDMAAALPGYTWIGTSVTGEDNVERRHFNPIFYKTDKFEVLESGSFWYSETPNVPNTKFSDSYSPRMCNWAHFRVKATGKEFYYFNTHLDHKGVVARREGVKLVVREVQQIAGRKAAVVVGGDLNSTIDDRIFDPLKKFMTPAREKAPVTDRKGTYNGWGQAPNSMVIDHLFVRNMKCLSYRTLDGDYGVPYISDHYPIEIVVRLK